MKKSIFLLLFSFSLPTFAERWFDVEIIVFKHNIAPNKAGELWPKNADKVDMSRVIGVNDQTSLSRYNIEPLPKSQLELTSQYNQLASSGKYQNLMHVGWRQNDSGRAQMPKLGLFAGKKVGGKSELSGYIRLYVDHYLFLETDLLLSQPTTAMVKTNYDPSTNQQGSSGVESYLQSVNFVQKRRMRSGEIHYLDHPLMGLIIQVRRLNQD